MFLYLLFYFNSLVSVCWSASLTRSRLLACLLDVWGEPRGTPTPALSRYAVVRVSVRVTRSRSLSLSLCHSFLSCSREKTALGRRHRSGTKNISMIWRPVSETLRIELAKLALKKQAATQTHERCTVLPSSYCWTQRRRIKDCPCHMFEHSLLSPEWLAGGVGARAEGTVSSHERAVFRARRESGTAPQ